MPYRVDALTVSTWRSNGLPSTMTASRATFLAGTECRGAMYPGPTPPGQRSPVSIGNGLHWKDIDEFTLLAAACLWAGIEPLNSFEDLQCSPEATAQYHMLTRAIADGCLEAHHRNPAPRTIKVAERGQHAPDMLVSRDDLVQLAKSIEQRPPFLFPSSQKRQQRTGIADSRKDDADLRKRIVSVLAYVRSRGFPKGTSKLKMVQQIKEQRKNEDFSESTLRQILSGRYPPMKRLRIDGLG